MPELTLADVADMCRDERTAVKQRGAHFREYPAAWAKVTREADDWQRAADVVEQLAVKKAQAEDLLRRMLTTSPDDNRHDFAIVEACKLLDVAMPAYEPIESTHKRNSDNAEKAELLEWIFELNSFDVPRLFHFHYDWTEDGCGSFLDYCREQKASVTK